MLSHTHQCNMIFEYYVLVFASLIGRKYDAITSICISLIMNKVEYVSLCLPAIHRYFFYELSHHITFPLLIVSYQYIETLYMFRTSCP